jgi:hypothetical protein
MKYLKSINEAILPKELRYKNLLFHSTSFENLVNILKENILKAGRDDIYTSSVSFTRCKDLLHSYEDEPGECQLIIDKDLLRTKYKIEPFDWMGMKYKFDMCQMEDRVVNNDINNIQKYIIGIHINNVSSNYIKELRKLLQSNWLIFDKNWELIKWLK